MISQCTTTRSYPWSSHEWGEMPARGKSEWAQAAGVCTRASLNSAVRKELTPRIGCPEPDVRSGKVSGMGAEVSKAFRNRLSSGLEKGVFKGDKP